MAKDPAILFYTSDFLTGTVLMSHEQVGIYIRLLCVLHQHGGSIDKEAFESFIGTHEILKTKFIYQDGQVLHKRLSEEMEKRQKKSSSLSNNANIRWNKCKSNANAYKKHMPIEDEDEDEIVNEVKTKAKKPTIEEVRSYCQERKNGVDPQKWHDFYTAKDWMIGKNKMKDWKAAIRTWEKNDNIDLLTDTQKRNIAKFNKFEQEHKLKGDIDGL